MKKITSLLLALLLVASMSVTAFASDYSNQTGNMSGTTDLNYTVTHEKTYTDISAVKLNWSVPVVKYTKTDTVTWNTTKLIWEETHPTSTTGIDVTFTLANYGSYAVKANVSFTPAVADSASVSFVKNEVDTNNPTLSTIVKDDHTLQVTQGTMDDDDAFAAAKTKYITDNCTKTISGTVSLDASKLSADTGKLGTYTVSIRNTKHTVTIMYCETDDNTKITTKTISVADGTEVTFTGTALTIDGTTYTDYFNDTEWAYYLGDDNDNAASLVSGSTVTADMTILAAH